MGTDWPGALHGRFPRAGQVVFPRGSRLSVVAGPARFRRCVSSGGTYASGVRPQRRAHALSRDCSAVERDSMTRKTLGIALSALLVVAAATAMALPARHLARARETAMAPGGPRVRVQVLNATKTRGLARRAMLYLRDQGFDVVEMGTTAVTRDTTLVL